VLFDHLVLFRISDFELQVFVFVTLASFAPLREIHFPVQL